MRSRSVSGPRGRNGWQDSCGLQLDPLSVVQGRERPLWWLRDLFQFVLPCVQCMHYNNQSAKQVTNLHGILCIMLSIDEFFSMA